MPPRSARKGAAAAKKQSPRLKQSTPPPPVPPVEDADITDPAAVVVKAGDEAEEDASLPSARAGDATEPAAVEEEVAAEKEMDAEEKEMDVDKEGEKQLVEDETRGEVENDHGDVVDKVGNDEGTARASDDNDESEEEADDEDNEEEADDEENEEEADEEDVDDKENEEDANDKENEEEADDEDDPALYMQAPQTERKTQKHFEIFVGGLDKGAVEEDLIKAFGAFGEIQSVWIAKHPVTQKSKGFAFVHYVSVENAKKVLTELKDGIEVKGKQIRISASDDNDTLYLGNICKTWTKDQVIETLKGYGIEQIEDILLFDDPKKEGRIKGFGFVEFASRSDAMAAFHRLRKPDALFGRDISAKVSFAQTPLHPSEESLLQVRTVYLEGIPKSWDEGKVEELCKQHGEIEKIQLPKNSSSKRKDYGFVEFSSRDSALACVEGINNAQFEEGEVKAKLAKPTYKGGLAKQSARGGYKVKKDGEATEAEAVGQSKKKKKAKSKLVHDKEETQPKLKSSNRSKPINAQGKGSKDGKGKMPQSSKGKKRGRQGMDIGTSDKPSKRTRKNQNHGKVHGRPSTASGNKRRSYSQQTMYGPSYATPGASYTAHAYAGTSGSHYRRSDMEPHAGFLPAAQQVQNPYGYDLRRAGAYDSQLRGRSGYAGVGASEGFRAYGNASNFWQGKQVNSPTGKLHYGSECTDGLRSETPEFVTDSYSCSNSDVSILPISSRIAPVRGVHISEPVTMKVAYNKFCAETMYTFSKEENMVQHNTAESSVRAPSSQHKGMPYSHVLNPIPSELFGTYDSNCSYDKYIAELESPTTEPMVYYYPAKACSISTSFQPTAPAANVTSSYTGLSMRKDKSFTVEDRYGTRDDNVYHVSLKEQHRMNQNIEDKENCNVSRITNVQTYPGISMDYFSSLESTLEKPRLHSMGLTTALKTNHVDLPSAFTTDYGLAEPVHSPSQNSSGTLDQTVDSPCWKGASVSVQSPFSSLEPKLLHESTESGSQLSRLLHSLDGSKRLEGGLGPLSVSEKCLKDLAVTAEYSDCLSSLDQVRREESSSVLPTMQQKCEDTCKTLLDCGKQIRYSGSCREENVEARSDKEREPDDKDNEVALLGQVSVISSSQPKLTSGIANRKTSYKCVMHGNSSECQPPVTDYATPSAIVESLGSSLVTFKEASLNVFLGTLQYLSERLLSSDHFDTSELKDHDHEVIRSVIDNLEAFSIMNKKDVAKGSYRNSELAAAQSKTMMDHDGKNLSNINISHEKGSMQCLAFSYDQDVTMKIQEKKDSEQEEKLQSLVYKKLWIDAEAALCSMKYKLRLAQMKTEPVNNNYQAEGNSQQLSLLSRLNFVYEENEKTLLKGKQSSRPTVELSANKPEVDPSVMARLNVLKGRHDRPSSDKEDVDPSVMARLDVLNGRDGGSSCMFTKNQQKMVPSDVVQK